MRLQRIEFYNCISARVSSVLGPKYSQNGYKKVTNSYSTLSQLLVESIYRGAISEKSLISHEPFPLRNDWDGKLVCGWCEPEHDFWVNSQNDDGDYEDEDWNEQQLRLFNLRLVFRFLAPHVVNQPEQVRSLQNARNNTNDR
jgi:hypothetical protein